MIKKQYRHNVKQKLQKALLLLGYQEYNGYFVKYGDRKSITIRLDDKTFNMYYRECPAKEGWFIQDFKYTYDNIERMKAIQ